MRGAGYFDRFSGERCRPSGEVSSALRERCEVKGERVLLAVRRELRRVLAKFDEPKRKLFHIFLTPDRPYNLNNLSFDFLSVLRAPAAHFTDKVA